MSSIYLSTPLNLDVTGFVDSLHIDKHVNRIIFSNIAERHVSLIVSAPLNGFLKLSLFPGFSILCLCEPSLLRETVTRNTAFSKIMIHTYSDEVEFRIVPNSEHPVCTLFVEVSFLIVFRHLKTLQKLVSELTQLKNSMETWQIVLQTSFRMIFTCANK